MKAQSEVTNLKKSIEILSTLPYKRGKYSSRYWGHRFHSFISYPSKLKPSMAYFLVYLFTKKGEIIFDPFSGVGTIPFEACSQGRFGWGADINPIAYYATKTKIEPIPSQKVIKQLDLLRNYIEKHKSEVNMEDVEEEIIPFYHPDTLKEILAAKDFFSKKSDMQISFLMTCMLHILHGNRPYALSRRSHNIMPWPPKGEFVYKSVTKSLTDKAIRMIKAVLPPTFVKGKTMQDNVLNLSLNNETVDCIITSPPFYNNRDFLRMNRIRLWFCGWNYEKQDFMKAAFLEHQKELKVYENVFKEFARVLRPNKLCIMHLGVVRKVDMAKNLVPLAETAGFKVLSIIYEDTSNLESHGIRDRGATQKHQFLILQKEEWHAQ